MGLSTVRTVFRYILLFLCLATFAFDIFFIYVYTDYPTVALANKYFIETGLVGSLILILVLSEIGYRISDSRRRRARTRQQTYDFEQHAAYLPSTSEAPISTNHRASIDPPAKTVYEETPSVCASLFSVIRFLFVWAISAALLNVTIKTFIHQERMIFTLPFSRDSTQGNAAFQDNQYKAYAPHDLFDCPSISSGDLLSMLCLFDQITMTIATLAAAIAILEGLLTIILDNRKRSYYAGSAVGVSDSGNRRSMMKKRPEVYDQAELGNAPVVSVVAPAPAPIEMHPYGAYSQNHHSPRTTEDYTELDVNHDHHTLFDQRPLPPLPAEFEENDNNEILVPYDAAHTGLNPFKADIKDSKHVWATTSSDPMVQGESPAGPSNSHYTYAADVKRSDGL